MYFFFLYVSVFFSFTFLLALLLLCCCLVFRWLWWWLLWSSDAVDERQRRIQVLFQLLQFLWGDFPLSNHLIAIRDAPPRSVELILTFSEWHDCQQIRLAHFLRHLLPQPRRLRSEARRTYLAFLHITENFVPVLVCLRLVFRWHIFFS